MFPLILLIIFLSTLTIQTSCTDNITVELNVEKIRLPQITEWMPKYLNCEIQISCAKVQREGQQEDDVGMVWWNSRTGKPWAMSKFPGARTFKKCQMTKKNEKMILRTF